ncbi:MAG: hypothetical protein A3E83_02840 [Gammaproteobacteria bacterium RIFCSPHIGHO2_12_FULL_41_20]|nr:MAG: hypothetical protein A3E83_02840 [Gammaproteobacteria bacterium RIFCSPHIGHO2_12_FULL_41_20]
MWTREGDFQREIEGGGELRREASYSYSELSAVIQRLHLYEYANGEIKLFVDTHDEDKASQLINLLSINFKYLMI